MAAKLEIERFDLPGLVAVTPARHGDRRGFLSEVYNRDRFASAGIDVDFFQDNHTFTAERGVIRGLHFQLPPFAQAKLVRVVQGEVIDVVVDIRHGSPTFGKHAAVHLSAENWKQLFVPAGFAHAFCTITENVAFLYKMSAPYSPDHDRGLAFDDPALGIDWPVPAGEAILSDRDRNHPRLADLPVHFIYEADR